MSRSAKPKHTNLFMNLIQVFMNAYHTEPAHPCTLIPGLILYSHPHGTIAAFAGTNPKVCFAGFTSDLSPQLIAMLAKAATMAWDDSLRWSARRPGKPSIIKGKGRPIPTYVNLDNLPDGLPLTKLRRVMEAARSNSTAAKESKKAAARPKRAGLALFQ
ncbi:MAG: hypothetical protein Q9184_000371 [Pyrenodesmia sp. 2 TL-2023]